MSKSQLPSSVQLSDEEIEGMKIIEKGGVAIESQFFCHDV